MSKTPFSYREREREVKIRNEDKKGKKLRTCRLIRIRVPAEID